MVSTQPTDDITSSQHPTPFKSFPWDEPVDLLSDDMDQLLSANILETELPASADALPDFDMMSFARLMCNNKAGIFNSILFDKDDEN